jgi:hypothetical protein
MAHRMGIPAHCTWQKRMTGGNGGLALKSRVRLDAAFLFPRRYAAAAAIGTMTGAVGVAILRS